jgi:hypothetical protein
VPKAVTIALLASQTSLPSAAQYSVMQHDNIAACDTKAAIAAPRPAPAECGLPCVSSPINTGRLLGFCKRFRSRLGIGTSIAPSAPEGLGALVFGKHRSLLTD